MCTPLLITGVADMPGLRWGRLQFDVDCELRRGAWYRVVRLQGLDAVVDLNHKALPVPLYVLEVVSTPPKRWTIVPAPTPSRRVPKAHVPYYAVCPSCRERSAVSHDARSLRCERCRGEFDVAWDETYLST